MSSEQLFRAFKSGLSYGADTLRQRQDEIVRNATWWIMRPIARRVLRCAIAELHIALATVQPTDDPEGGHDR